MRGPFGIAGFRRSEENAPHELIHGESADGLDIDEHVAGAVAIGVAYETELRAAVLTNHEFSRPAGEVLHYHEAVVDRGGGRRVHRPQVDIVPFRAVEVGDLVDEAGSVQQGDSHRRIAVVEFEEVLAITARQRVVATATAQDVPAAAAVDDIGAAIAGDDIVAEAAVDVLDRDETIGAIVMVLGAAADVVDHHVPVDERLVAALGKGDLDPAVIGRIVDRVRARAAIEEVVAKSVAEGVVATLAKHAVISSAAKEGIVTDAAIERVGVIAAMEDVVALVAIEPVFAIAAIEGVVIIAAVEGVLVVTAVNGVIAVTAANDVVPPFAVERVTARST